MAPQQPELPIEAPSQVQFRREICGNLPAAEAREWLVTNGIGGFASGTIAGGMTRRYHGLLIAALQPPLGRTHLVAALDEIVHYAGAAYALATHRWASGAVDPQGFLYLESFRLEGTIPVWTYALADALLEKRMWMVQGENTTFIHYTLVRASGPVEMDLKALVNYRDFHSLTHAGDWHMKIALVEFGVMMLPFDGATPFYLKSAQASCEPHHEWYRDCYLPMETERGLDDHEDHLFAALFRAKLKPARVSRSSRPPRQLPRSMAKPHAPNAPITKLTLLQVLAGAKRKIRRERSLMAVPTRSRRRSIHRQAQPPRGAGRPQHHRRLSLVRRLGPRHR